MYLSLRGRKIIEVEFWRYGSYIRGEKLLNNYCVCKSGGRNYCKSKSGERYIDIYKSMGIFGEKVFTGSPLSISEASEMCQRWDLVPGYNSIPLLRLNP